MGCTQTNTTLVILVKSIYYLRIKGIGFAYTHQWVISSRVHVVFYRILGYNGSSLNK